MAAPVVPLTFVPQSMDDWRLALADPMWRLCSGMLYQILVKAPDESNADTIVPFKPNRAQRRFISRLHHRNVILKARQLGFTTLIAIMWLDHALFNENQRCVIVAQDKEKAEDIFRDKVVLAYDRLPEAIRLVRPVLERNTTTLRFANNSQIRVATSARGGTTNRLHISEMGKIGAKFPAKALEIVTGSFPAVPMLDGIIVVESTAEGQDGQFYKIVTKALESQEKGEKLNARQFRMHFFPWWAEPDYRLAKPVIITKTDHEYFDGVEASQGTTLDLEQRQWYVATRDNDYSGEEELMWQEYPSTSAEAFQVSTEGTYYPKQLQAARKQKRIGFFPMVDGIPVNTFWDIGSADGTGIWLHQRIGAENRFFAYLEAWGESYSYFATKLQQFECVWGTHYVPHDAGHKRQQADVVSAPIDALEALQLGGKWAIVPRVADIVTGIQMTRAKFSTCTFDAEGCKEGLVHLGAYRKEWDENRGTWKLQPRHDIHSEAADAFRQFGQGYVPKALIAPPKAGKTAGWRVN